MFCVVSTEKYPSARSICLLTLVPTGPEAVATPHDTLQNAPLPTRALQTPVNVPSFEFSVTRLKTQPMQCTSNVEMT